MPMRRLTYTCIVIGVILTAFTPANAGPVAPGSGEAYGLAMAWFRGLNTSIVAVFVYGGTIFVWTNTSLALYSVADGEAVAVYTNVSTPSSPLYVVGNTYMYLSNTGQGLILYRFEPGRGVERIELGQAASMGSMYIAASYIDIPVFLVSHGFSMAVLRLYRNGTVEQLNETSVLYLSRPVLGDSNGDGIPDYSDGEVKLLYSAAGGESEIAIYYAGSMGTFSHSYRGWLFPYLATVNYSPTRGRTYLVIRGYELQGAGGFTGNNTLLIYDIRNNALADRYTEEITLGSNISVVEEMFYRIEVVDDSVLRAGKGPGNETVIYAKPIGAGRWKSLLGLGNAMAQITSLPDIDGDGGLDALVTTNTSEAYIVFHNTSTAGPYPLNITRPHAAGAAIVNDTVYIVYYNETGLAAARISMRGGGEGEEVIEDKEPPVIKSFNADVYEDIVLFTWSVVDNCSGIASILLEVDGKTINVTGRNLYRLIGVSPGTHAARLLVSDAAGNKAVKEITFTVKENRGGAAAGGGEEGSSWLLAAVAAAMVAAAIAYIMVRQRRAPSGAI